MMLREPWRTRLLFISFAVNLVAVPMAGMRYVMHRPRPPGPPRPEVVVDRLASELPEADGARLRTAVAPHIGDIEAARVRMEAARAAMMGAIGRTPFDPDAAHAAMRTWQAAWTAWSDGMGGAMLGALGDLSPEGRQRLAEAGLHRRHR